MGRKSAMPPARGTSSALLLSLLLLGVDVLALRPRTDRTLSQFFFGSCSKHDRPQPAWETILSRRTSTAASSLFVWLGDIIYADKPIVLKLRIPGNAATISNYYDLQLARPDYANFSSQTEIVGVYDDHDYGINDGSRHFHPATRTASQQLLLDFLQEPADSPRRLQEGVYVTYTFGEAPTRVRLILLDNRSNKDEYDELGQDMLGDPQWRWLEELLSQPDQPEITFIGAGLQIIARGDPWIAESWSRMPQSQAKLLALIAVHRVPGVVLLSGDIHFSELNSMSCHSVGYPLYELTSSGLTHSWSGVIKSNVVKGCLMASTRVDNKVSYEQNVGQIDIKWVKNDAGDLDYSATTITLQSVDVHTNATHFSHLISLAELQPSQPVAGMRAPPPPPNPYDRLANGRPLPPAYRQRWGGGGTSRDAGSESNPLPVGNAMERERAARECAVAPLTAGFTSACAEFMASCTPRQSPADSRFYYTGHVVVLGSIALLLAGLAAAPCLIVAFRAALPGPMALWLALVAAVYAVMWTFMRSLG